MSETSITNEFEAVATIPKHAPLGDLDNLDRLIEELNTTNSTNSKKEILAKYPQCQSLLMYTYNSFYQYGVTSANCQKHPELCDHNVSYTNIIDLLNDLKSRTITGHAALSAVNGFVHKYIKYESLIWNVIDRNLKVRMDSKIINDVFEDCVPTFKVALAHKFDDKTKKHIKFDGSCYASCKMDGVRCITIVYSRDDIKTFSREGNEFTTLDVVKDQIRTIFDVKDITNTVFDGEMCITYNDKEDFKAIVSQIKRKNFTIQNPRYKMFDMLTLEEFLKCTSDAILSERFDRLNATIPKGNGVIQVHEQTLLTNEEMFNEMWAKAKRLGWEGLILRNNVKYEAKRTNNMLKVKKFLDAEFKVIDVEFGLKPILVDGVMKERDVLAAVVVEYKNNKVKVGSGFSDDQRLHYRAHPEAIIGKHITVQYFEESTNQDGGISLRFPTLKQIWETKRDI